MDENIAAFLSFAKNWYPYGIPIEQGQRVLVSFLTNNPDNDSALITAAAEKGIRLLSNQYEICSDISSCKGRYIIAMGKNILDKEVTEGEWDDTGRILVTMSPMAIQSSYDEKKKFWEHLKKVIKVLWE